LEHVTDASRLCEIKGNKDKAKTRSAKFAVKFIQPTPVHSRDSSIGSIASTVTASNGPPSVNSRVSEGSGWSETSATKRGLEVYGRYRLPTPPLPPPKSTPTRPRPVARKVFAQVYGHPHRESEETNENINVQNQQQQQGGEAEEEKITRLPFNFSIVSSPHIPSQEDAEAMAMKNAKPFRLLISAAQGRTLLMEEVRPLTTVSDLKRFVAAQMALPQEYANTLLRFIVPLRADSAEGKTITVSDNNATMVQLGITDGSQISVVPRATGCESILSYCV